MTRRELLLLLCGAISSARAARAQQKAMKVIGIRVLIPRLAPNEARWNEQMLWTSSAILAGGRRLDRSVRGSCRRLGLRPPRRLRAVARGADGLELGEYADQVEECVAGAVRVSIGCLVAFSVTPRSRISWTIFTRPLCRAPDSGNWLPRGCLARPRKIDEELECRPAVEPGAA